MAKKGISTRRKIISYALGTIIFLIIAVQCSKSGSSGTHQDELKSSALAACRAFINQDLKNPNSAKYGAGELDRIAAGVWRVQRSLRAQNGFGAMVPATYICLMKYDGKEFHLIKLESV